MQRSHANKLYMNLNNYYVYQITPYSLRQHKFTEEECFANEIRAFPLIVKGGCCNINVKTLWIIKVFEGFPIS